MSGASYFLNRFSPSKNPDWVWVCIFFPSLVAYLILLTSHLNLKPTTGYLEALDPLLFHQLISKTANIEIIAEGFQWCEGPLWMEKDGSGYLLFSDTVTNQIWKWEEGQGLFTIGKTLYYQKSGCSFNSTWCDKIKEPGSNGLRSLSSTSQDLLVCQHGNRRIGALFMNGSFTTIASEYQGHRLNSPNDFVISYDKNLYFTDPPYGLYSKSTNELIEKDLSFNGVYMIEREPFLHALSTGRETKEIILVEETLSRPNGIGLSPGSTRLFVSNSDRKFPVWNVYDINPTNGRLESGRVFYNCEHLYPEGEEAGIGNPDGFKIDINGNLFASGPGGVLVISSSGILLGRIRIEKKVSNVVFGGDGYLYITASDQVMRVPVLTKPIAPVAINS
jgi:gluconolactonase